MEQFFAKDFAGPAFTLFGPAHWTGLGVLVLLNVWLLLRGRRIPERWRGRLRYTLAAVLLVNEMAWHAWNWATGQWTLQTMLPLHLCSVFVFVSAAALITKSYRLYEFVYFLGIIGAVQPLFTPDLGVYGYPHFRFFQTFISHGSIVTAAIYLTAVEGYRPTLQSLLRVLVWGNVYMVVVGGVNALLGSNYLYIAHKPDTPSLIDLMPPWPWYILFIELLGVVLVTLLYLPFARSNQCFQNDKIHQT
jgi:hypothetical integral membrane protein (TIGR02206 family)